MAVIVILAIIALIAVPIILNIVNDARESAKERSRELYSKAVQNAVLKEQLNGDTIKDGHYEKVSDTSICRFENGVATNDCITVEVEGEQPVVYTMEIIDGKITSQTIQLKATDPTYTKEGNGKWTKGEDSNNNEEPEQQASTTRYYYWGSGSISGGLPTTNIDRDVSNITIPNNHPFYLAFDSADGETIAAAYVCFVKTIDETPTEFCIKGGVAEELRAEVFTSNQGILDTAFPSACSLDEDFYYCDAGGLHVYAYSHGDVSADDGRAGCGVSSDGNFGCDED